jgi:hypothetical protein
MNRQMSASGRAAPVVPNEQSSTNASVQGHSPAGPITIKPKRLSSEDLKKLKDVWTKKAESQKARLERSAQDGYEIALSIADVQDQPRDVKRAYTKALFGDDAATASVYKTIGQCALLHEESTKNVIGVLPVNAAIQFARMGPETQSDVLSWFRDHPEKKPSKRTLREARKAAGELRSITPTTGADNPSKHLETDGLLMEGANAEELGADWIAVIRPLSSQLISTWDNAKQQAALQYLNELSGELTKHGMALELSPQAARINGVLNDS